MRNILAEECSKDQSARAERAKTLEDHIKTKSDMIKPPKKRIIVVVGPTASGKTAVAVEIARALDGEVISADSMQIYRHMDVGTAKPTTAERKGIPHHLLDFVQPDEEYSASRFQKDAFHAIEDIIGRGKQPIIAGGTGLYINAITYALDFSGGKRDTRLGKKLEELYDKKGADYMHRALTRKSPVAASKVHKNNKVRVVRQLELAIRGENRQYEFDQPNNLYDFKIIGLTKARPVLYNDIEQRVDQMVKNGLVEEAYKIYTQFPNCQAAAKAIGYKELFQYFKGDMTLDEAIDQLKQNTRRFAKRQLTWFSRDQRIFWFDLSQYPQTSRCIADIIRYCSQ